MCKLQKACVCEFLVCIRPSWFIVLKARSWRRVPAPGVVQPLRGELLLQNGCSLDIAEFRNHLGKSLDTVHRHHVSNEANPNPLKACIKHVIALENKHK